LQRRLPDADATESLLRLQIEDDHGTTREAPYGYALSWTVTHLIAAGLLKEARALLCSSSFTMERASDVGAVIRDCVNVADSVRDQVRHGASKHGTASVAQGGPTEESDFYERSIETWKAAFGEEHSNVAFILSTFGWRLYHQVRSLLSHVTLMRPCRPNTTTRSRSSNCRSKFTRMLVVLTIQTSPRRSTTSPNSCKHR